ncbi:NAD(P)H-binding protein [bacterium]|nr:NAD(P)H-binding protein [bacterium]
MEAQSRSIAVVGATGAVGAPLCALLSRRDDLQAQAVARRHAPHCEINQQVVDFDDHAALNAALQCDVLICALGTTQAKAGKAGLKAVDQELVVRCARAAADAGAARLVVVSALGASARSPSWYSRVKAAMEAEVQQLGFESVHIVRPSLLLGERDENRPAEALGQRAAPLLNWLVPPSWRAIDVHDVASALLELALRDDRGTWVHLLPLAAERSKRIG